MNNDSAILQAIYFQVSRSGGGGSDDDDDDDDNNMGYQTAGSGTSSCWCTWSSKQKVGYMA